MHTNQCFASLAAMALLLGSLTYQAQAQGNSGPTVIDKLTTPQAQLLRNNTLGDQGIGSTIPEPDDDLVVGSERDMFLQWDGPVGVLGEVVAEVAPATLIGGHDGLGLWPALGAVPVNATLIVQWDGDDGDAENLDILGVVNAQDKGEINLHKGNGNTIAVDMESFGKNTTLTFTIYSDLDECSTLSFSPDVDIPYETPTVIDFNMSNGNGDFSVCAGATKFANYAQVSAIEMRVVMVNETVPFAIASGSIEVVRRGPLPIELTQFSARTDGPEVVLDWTTASETSNSGFAVQVTPAGQHGWQDRGWLAGAGTTTEAQSYQYRLSNLDPGTYEMRLKAIDFDGSVSYSETVEATVAVPGAYHLTNAYPNPFNPQTTFTLSLQQAQPVRVEVLNLLGQRVQVLHEGPLSANTAHRFTLDGSALPSGLYLYRVTGPRFTETRSVVLLK